MTTKQVWAQVEISDDHWDRGKLVGGIDLDKAKEALTNLYRFRPGDAPGQLFNTKNGMYTPRRSLKQVIKADFKQSPTKIAKIMLDERYVLAITRATPERVAEWQKDHPKEEAEVVTKLSVNPGRDAYLALSQRRIEKSIDQLMNSKPAYVNQLGRVAQLMNVSPTQLARATQGDDDAPFFSESYLYTLLGKDHARSILGRLGTLAAALGIDPWTIDTGVAEEDE